MAGGGWRGGGGVDPVALPVGRGLASYLTSGGGLPLRRSLLALRGGGGGGGRAYAGLDAGRRGRARGGGAGGGGAGGGGGGCAGGGGAGGGRGAGAAAAAARAARRAAAAAAAGGRVGRGGRGAAGRAEGGQAAAGQRARRRAGTAAELHGAQCASAEQVLGDNDVAGLRHRVAQLHTHVERQLSLMGELRKGVGDAQSEAAGVSAELAERLPQLKAEVDDAALTTSHTALTTPYDPAYNPYDPLQPLVQPVRPLTTPQVDDVASARLPGLQRQLLTLGDSTNAMWEVINGLVQGGEQGGASREDDFGSARRGAAYDYSDEVQFPQPVYAACSDVGRRGRGPCSRAVQKWSRTSSPVDRLRPRRRGSLKSMLPSQVCRTSCGRSLGFFPGMVGFLSKSFRAATGVKDLEGKFEMLLQGRYRCFRELSQTSPEPPPRATHITKACPATMHPPPGRATTPAHDHATSPLHAHAHSTRNLERVRVGLYQPHLRLWLVPTPPLTASESAHSSQSQVLHPSQSQPYS